MQENILLEAFELSQAVAVNLSVDEYPSQSAQLFHGNVILNSQNNYSVLTTIMVIKDVFYVIILKWILYKDDVKDGSFVSHV